MQLQFNTVSEPTQAGAKWKRLVDIYWPKYRTWFLSPDSALAPDLKTSQEALKKYMPKMVATYNHLCKITNAGPDLARFLTGFQPPAYVNGCAQAVINTDEIQLVRNYDYDLNLFEGTLLLSKWNKNKVIATSDCLIGVVDGMNDEGLCVSMTFGGRKEVGVGFGIPFILRYVLEFCTTTREALQTLKSIPSHMSYNVTVVDKLGDIKTIMLAPDKKPEVTTDVFATNHQGKVDWPENAQFNQTVKRYNFIKSYLKSKDISTQELAKAFLHPPLYNSNFTGGFGTLYTSVYQPEKLRMKLIWPNVFIERSFDNFAEDQLTIYYNHKNPVIAEPVELLNPANSWQEAVVDSLVQSIAGKQSKSKQNELHKKLMPNGEISWEVLLDYWNEPISK